MPSDLIPTYAPIRDYALIGDCRTAALVSRWGSVDFLCLPRFDGPSVFAALLDAHRGGRFFVRPAVEFRARRRYVGPTNVLETTFETAGGVLRLTDVMSVAGESERRGELLPEHELLRRVECLGGEVEVEVGCDPRPGWSAVEPVLRDRGALGFTWDFGGQLLALRSEVPIARRCAGGQAPPGPRHPGCAGICGRETLKEGDRRFLSLASATAEPGVFLPLGDAAARRLERSLRWWRQWAAGCSYAGPSPEAVVRSLLTLKLLSYSPSGAVIAAPTTSLPEEIGGSRNWDYRYCWLRDASWTLAAFFDLGFREEGQAFFSWLLYATRMRTAVPAGHRWTPRLRILNVLYDVHGEVRLRERQLPWLQGYAGSRPVRVGNGAHGQLQLDIFGEVVQAAFEYVERGGTLDASEGRLLRQLGETVSRLWREPDEGIWEKRSGRSHHTYSKAMCWVALDKLLLLAQRGAIALPAAGVHRFRREREALRHAIETEGFSPRLGSYVDVLGGEDLDASLLLLGLRGWDDPATSPRLASTLAAVRGRLESNGLLYRYPPGADGIPGGEAAFGICNFWLAEFLARAGRLEEALAQFQRVLGYANDLGLYGEEIDPRTGAALGNFPQAFTHVGLISAALAITAACGGRRRPGSAASGAGSAGGAEDSAAAAGSKGVRM
ncbi:MAG TPA: glycoside hydrolase family 15 protein [Thermoanaerobaculia bacterium]|nr:glycoside hydrolase family 15 protein [Thermoanaerobaculia bacterium]